MRIEKNNIEELLFNLVEGNLKEQEKAELFSFLEANPQYQGEVDFWKKTVAEEQETEVFTAKESLVQKTILQKYGKYAALALLLIGASAGYFAIDTKDLMTTTNDIDNSEIESAITENKVEVAEETIPEISIVETTEETPPEERIQREVVVKPRPEELEVMKVEIEVVDEIEPREITLLSSEVASKQHDLDSVKVSRSRTYAKEDANMLNEKTNKKTQKGAGIIPLGTPGF